MAGRKPGTHRFAVFLRGINVGGRNMLAMPALRSALAAHGFGGVSTYLQSGNVVLDTPEPDPVAVATAVEMVIATQLGATVTVVARTHAELAAIAAANPFPAAEREPKTLHVVFLDRAPAAAAAGSLDPDRSPPDRFVLGTREVYVHYPRGSGRSKLTLAWLERGLGVRGTARNWNTLLELIERTRPPET